MRELIIINADEYCTVVRQQLMQKPQSRVHHAEPLVVTRKILAFLANDLSKSFFQLRVVHIVVVNPPLVARVVRRIDVDAFDSALVARQQRLQRGEIVAVDDHVFIRTIIAFATGSAEVLEIGRFFRNWLCS